jgi:putative membrane protein
MPKSRSLKSVQTALALLAVVLLASCAAPAPPPAPPAAPPPAPEAAPQPGPPSASSDQDFLNQAMGMGAAEIGMGRLAHGKAASKAVKALGARMVADHTGANHRLAALAKHLKIDVTPTPDQPPPDLLTSSGPAFDKLYIDMAIKAHQNMIALFEGEANSGQDPRVKHLARSMLPELHHHLRESEAIGKQLGL